MTTKEKSKRLKHYYFDWLFKGYNFLDINDDVVEITTPFLDPDFDSIIMYAEFLNNNTILLTDDGWTIDNLESHGVSFSKQSKIVNHHLQEITNYLGLEVNQDKEIFIKTSIDKFPIAKQRLLQGIMQVNDLIVFQKNSKSNLLSDIIEEILLDNDIIFDYKPAYTGKNGITVQFDFSIPTHGRANSKVIKAISNGNNLNSSKLLTMDTQLLKYTKYNHNYIAIFDDINHPINNMNDIVTVFEENSSTTISSYSLSTIKKDASPLSNSVA